MAYSKNLRKFKDVESYLDEMVDAEDDLVWRTDNPVKFSAALRNGIKVAIEEQKGKYYSLQNKFVIRMRGLQVIAEIRHKTKVFAVTDNKTKFPFVHTVEGIVETIITKPQHTTYVFPDFPFFNDEDKQGEEDLNSYCNKNNLSIDSTAIFLTIRRNVD